MSIVIASIVLAIAVIALARSAPSGARRFALHRRRKAAERRWKLYAKQIGKDWRELTPREKLEAHGLPREERHDGSE